MDQVKPEDRDEIDELLEEGSTSFKERAMNSPFAKGKAAKGKISFQL